jgi:Trk K+ transport system NAD-binding subunit
MQMRNIDGTEFVDLMIKDDSRATGKTVGELAGDLPNDCIFISIRRNGRVMIPHGDTKLLIGDQITAFIQTRDVEKLYQCLQGPEEG